MAEPEVDVPTGRVALVFTDVQASSVLWEQDAPTMGASLAIHDAVLREQIALHEGYEVRTEGDAFVVAFADPGRAVAWCVATQRALEEAFWPAALLRHREGAPGPAGRGLHVRMGVHVGPVDAHRNPVTGRAEYTGATVPRGLAVSDAGHGGQILVSAAVREAVDLPGLAFAAGGDAPPATLPRFADLGEHRLKGLEGSEHLWEVRIPDLPRTFPPVRSLPNLRTNLPAPPASFLGRDVDLAALAALAGPGLVSLVGPQGIGKSRLAVRFASDHLAEHGSIGVWLCPLGGAATAAGVAQRVGRALGLASAETPAQVGAALAARAGALVVLDDLEPAVAAETVGRWLVDAPGVAFLATVRAPTGLPGERVHPVGPLPASEAAALLRERLRRAPDPAEDSALDALAGRLGGLPAAIECAALRLDVASATDLLAGAEELALAQTDPAAYAWAALTAAEREALAAWTCLCGDFDPAAAAAAAGVADVGPVLARLRAAGAVVALGERHRIATRMLPLARGHLEATGGVDAATARTHAWFGALARAFEEGRTRPGAAERARALRPDVEDLQDAAARALDPEVRVWAALGASRLTEVVGGPAAGRPLAGLDADALPGPLAARLLGRLAQLATRVRPAEAAALARAALDRAPADARLRGSLLAATSADLPVAEREAALRALLAETPADREPEVRLEALLALTALLPVQFRPDLDALADEARALARAAGDELAAIQLLTTQGIAATRRGEFARATSLLTDAATRAEAFGPGRTVALKVNLGLNLEQAGDFAGAEREWRAGLHAAVAEGQQVVEAALRNNLGFVRLARGVPALAEALLRSALRTARAVGYDALLGYALSNLGTALAAQGDLAGALSAHAEGWSALASGGDHAGRGLMGCGYAATLAEAGDLERAEAVLAEAASAYRASGIPHGDEMVRLVGSRIGLERARRALRAAEAESAALAGHTGGAADLAILRGRLARAVTEDPAGTRHGPTGRIAIVFASVEASTDLNDRVPDAMAAAARAVEHTLRALLAAFHGYEVRIHPAAALSVFADARQALAYCIEAQRTLLETDWPPRLLGEPEASELRAPTGALLFRGLRVRMGVHVGTPEPRPDPVTGRTDYFGPVMNRAARVSAAGHGGQVLLSGSAWAEVSRELPADLVAAELGVHRLKGLEAPEALVQVLPAELAARRFAPPRTLDARRTNVAASDSWFAGRAVELASIDALFRGGSRWVTLVGPGGIGKTRLLQHYAASRLDGYGDDGGCWWIELAGVATGEALVRGIGDAVGASVGSRGDLDEDLRALGDALAARGPILLALDDLDHLVGAGALLAILVERAPEARLLVSCRHRLGDAAEVVLEIGPLPAADAVGLLVARVREHGAPVADAELAQVAPEIVERVQGLPLAVELAAADLRTRGVAQVLADAPAAATTASAAIDAALLHASEAARDALAQLAVFAAAFSPADVPAVVAGVDAAAALDELRDRGLVRPVPGDAGGRIGLWRNVRPHAAAALEARADRAAIAARHAAWAVRTAEGLVGALGAPDDGERARALAHLAHHARELERVLGAAGPADAVRAALALDRVLAARGPADRHRATLDAAAARLAEPGGDVIPAGLAARLLLARADLGGPGAAADAARARVLAGDDAALRLAADLALASSDPSRADALLPAVAPPGAGAAAVARLAVARARAALRSGRLQEAEVGLRSVRTEAPEAVLERLALEAALACRAGRADEALHARRAAAERAVAAGARRAGARHLARLAATLAWAERSAEAEAAVADGLAHAQGSTDRAAEVELHAVCALGRLAAGDAAGAEAALAAAEGPDVGAGRLAAVARVALVAARGRPVAVESALGPTPPAPLDGLLRAQLHDGEGLARAALAALAGD